MPASRPSVPRRIAWPRSRKGFRCRPASNCSEGPSMPQAVAGPEIERLIQLLARLPGLGPRSARRAALHLIKKRELLLAPLSDALRVASERIVVCSRCGNVDTADPCTVCRDPKRDGSILVVVEDVSDLWALERSGAVNARY